MKRAAFACLVAISVAPLLVTRARADGPVVKHASSEAVHAAQAHMQKARALYEAGNYPDAIAELETARALDPHAKDLVFNLGIVHEKALHIEEALHFYRLYLDMDLDPPERARAEAIVKRLEGARVHVQPTATVTTTTSTTGASTVAPPPTTTIIVAPSGPSHGRFDGLTGVMGFLALAGFGVGAGFGIAALGAQPKAGYVTGNDANANGTYAQLQASVDQAHMLATIADIGFLSGVVFTTITLAVFFGRTKKTESRAIVTVAPQANGGSLVLRGTF